jgi:large subunit ribosomal protein L4
MSKLPLKNIKGESVGDYEVADNLLVLDKGDHAVHEAVVAYQAHQRAGTASTLGKGAVSGSNKKPWKQKGLGRARAGYRQSPVWRGGGSAHGPHPHKFHKKVSKKVGQLAFQRAFSAKVGAGELTVVESLEVASPKTKEFTAILRNLGLERGGLFIVGENNENVLLAARNIPRVEIATAALVNTYQLLRYKNVIVTKAGMDVLEKRLA